MPVSPTRFRPKTALVGLAVTALVAAGLAGAASSDASTPVYENPHASPAARARDLVGRLSLAEKIGQMVQIQVGELYGDCTGYNAGPAERRQGEAGARHRRRRLDPVRRRRRPR